MNRNRIAKASLVGLILFLSVAGFAKTAVIAHRGYWKTEGSAKNSISSLSNAQKLGIYGSETDVHLSSDGSVIINHDDSIGGYDISSTPLAVLKTVKLSNGEALPTLEEYLNQTRKDTNMRLIIEIKNKKDTLLEQRTVKAVVDLVRKMKMNKAVEYISFSMLQRECINYRTIRSQISRLIKILLFHINMIGFRRIEPPGIGIERKDPFIQVIPVNIACRRIVRIVRFCPRFGRPGIKIDHHLFCRKLFVLLCQRAEPGP